MCVRQEMEKRFTGVPRLLIPRLISQIYGSKRGAER